jgi:uncharacterized protein
LILFLDTSALVKLYVEEEGSASVIAQTAAAELLAASRIAWVELMSALARRAREQPQTTPALETARQRFAGDWSRFLAVETTQPLVELAGDYTDTFALRAYDALQLAAVQSVHAHLPGEVRFACFDARLLKAAKVLGIEAAL